MGKGERVGKESSTAGRRARTDRARLTWSRDEGGVSRHEQATRVARGWIILCRRLRTSR